MTDPVPAAMRHVIDGVLTEIAAEETATILWAVESGSRAWGFHSSDSDFDVRFIYTRPVDWHLSVTPGRDVIERPISDALDLAGWDLRKTLGLIMGSNAAILEWLNAPIVYRAQPGFRDALLGFATQVLRRRPVMWHYFRLLERQQARLGPDTHIHLKTYFYTLRPALTLRWLRQRPDQAMAPMDMGRLMAETALPAATHAALSALIETKKQHDEQAGTAPRHPSLDALIETEAAAARADLGDARPEAQADAEALADDLHRHWVHRCTPQKAPSR